MSGHLVVNFYLFNVLIVKQWEAIFHLGVDVS